ncbi:bifunctional folylpolyglutamate synthase/dihydrofolate synthase [Latilactobacillus graminis]|uniref:Dihydrofolate synthase/folylpolyglutamate synthase n=2 Tax=Latilactobacillus graminis TaxID=60519 RepID=A0AA89I4K3_9LACO|nr:folylpolyglutamate synthase/dihydrofolate synthase family protein [Latilactobacillus graminis]KRM22289.1 folylpolyglutamate synthase [Latilactobacillus graminis DSM 20719]QFP79535.1 bifunctional folylpolyglutamate synthase/dihydrofolate synthase [Latilactobacillus graminis]
MTVTDYKTALAYIHSRPRLHKKVNLNRITQLLAALGNPQANQQFIHVTGTNGKGSVVKIVSCLIEELGLKVGRYTSPFIMRFNERIAINQVPISDTDLVIITQKIEATVALLQQSQPEFTVTEFECITAMMFLYFKQQAVDVAVIEVGIGGLYDSTNVLTPLVSVITSIGLDHQALLGQTFAEIATQKAGIIKEGHPVVVGQLPAAALAVVEDTARRLTSPLLISGRDFSTSSVKALPSWGQQLTFQNDTVALKQLQIPLMGDYQIENTAVALQVFCCYLQLTQQTLTIRDIKRGLNRVSWPGRFEKINDEPLIVLDGAHNPEGVAQLVQTIQHHFKNRDIYLLFGALGDKNLDQMLPPLKKIATRLVLTAVPDNARAANAKQYAVVDASIPFEPEWPLALTDLLADVSADDILIVTGSLYLISTIRQYFKGAQ